MSFLSEDPTYLLILLGVPAAGFLIALRVTQDGRHLIRAGVLGGLMLLVLGVEYLWVTDNERIEQTVKDLAAAVRDSDVDAVESYLAPDVSLSQRSQTLDEGVGISSRLEVLRDVKFDFLRVSSIEAHANPQSRTGTAVFRVLAGGSARYGMGEQNFGSINSEWSLGFREKDGKWKVTRITPLRLPPQANPAYLFRQRFMPSSTGPPPGADPSRGPRNRGLFPMPR